MDPYRHQEGVVGPDIPTGEHACRACGATVVEVLDLGRQPAAEGFPVAGLEVERYPLVLGICSGCRLVQLAGGGPDEAPATTLGAEPPSPPAAHHALLLAEEVVKLSRIRPGTAIGHLASHDLDLRPWFAELGFESERLAFSADGPSGLAEAASGARFGLLVDHYGLAHLRRPRLALEALVERLAEEGVLVLEFDHLLHVVSAGQFDAIRHGHHSYLTLGWVAAELRALDLEVVRVTRQSVYGGALRVWACRRGTWADLDPGDRDDVASAEQEARLNEVAGLSGLDAIVETARAETLAFLRAERHRGARVVGYGAPGRAVTFLNVLGIGPDQLPVTADRSTTKQGRVIPGANVPIVAPDALRAHMPATVLVLSWDLVDEIRSSMPWVEESGGRWAVALPRLSILDAVDGGRGRRSEPPG